MIINKENAKRILKMIFEEKYEGEPGPCVSNDDLWAYVEESLSCFDRDKVEYHLERCPECSAVELFISRVNDDSDPGPCSSHDELQEWVNGSLAEEDLVRVTHHLLNCPKCAKVSVIMETARIKLN